MVSRVKILGVSVEELLTESGLLGGELLGIGVEFGKEVCLRNTLTFLGFQRVVIRVFRQRRDANRMESFTMGFTMGVPLILLTPEDPFITPTLSLLADLSQNTEHRAQR